MEWWVKIQIEINKCEFLSKKKAFDWIHNYLYKDDETCVDNERFAYIDNKPQMKKYKEQQNNGCCGSIDLDINIKVRKATIGCNFGH